MPTKAYNRKDIPLLKLIVQHSPKLLAFVCGLHLHLHKPQWQHDRLSVTGALTVSPLQKRLGLYCSVASANLTGDEVFAFVQQCHRHLKHPLLVIWDRFSGHRKAARRLRDL